MKTPDQNDSFVLTQQEEISLLPKNLLSAIQNEESFFEDSKTQENIQNNVNIL